MIYAAQKNFLQKLLLLLSFFMSFLFFAPKDTHAIVVPVLDGAAVAELTALNVTEATSLADQLLTNAAFCEKEIGPICVPAAVLSWDGLMTIATQLLLEAVQTNFLTWLNNLEFGPALLGLQNEAFVRDVEGFFLNIQDDIAGNFGNEILDLFNDGVMCNYTPTFGVDLSNSIQLAPRTGYVAKTAANTQCTLDAVIPSGNIQNYYNDFSDGGWAAFEQSLYKNPFSEFVEKHEEYNRRVAEKTDQEEQKLAWGDGFFSLEDCDGVNCLIQSPAKAIQDLVSKNTGIQIDSLLNADELTETIVSIVVSTISDTIQSGL